MITQEELKALLDYDEVTGVFTWKVDRGRSKLKGKKAGTVIRGYLRISVNNKKLYAHRLAWLYVKGSLPSMFIDHIDGVKSNNSISNLREATRQENQLNRGKDRDNKSGFKGVTWKKSRSKWVAQTKFNSKAIYLGSFNTPEEAHEAYQEFALKNHGEFIHNSVSTALSN